MKHISILSNWQPMRMFRPSSDTSNEGDSWSGEDASGEQPVDPIIELGNTDFRGNGQKIKRSYKSKISKSPPCLVHRWIHQNRMRVFGIALVLVGVFVVSATFLFSSGVGEKDNPNANLESDPTSWVQRPGKNDQGSLSNTPPLPSFNVESPTQTPVRKPSHNSVFDRLSLVVDPSLLTDPETPQGKAYRWIDSIDDLRWSPNHPSLLQRFSLATFYFSTGGQRTTATWEVCSAVPSNILNEGRNAFSTRCVFDDNRFICAAIEDFLECPEYYERYNLVAPPVNPKKRWLSSASECDWYGVFCNERGNVEQLTLPTNGLEGALVSELEILNDLIHINLGGNKLTGALPEWGALASGMQHLSLDGNSFVGSIPYSAPHWANLKTLDLARNRFTGTLNLPGNWLQMETLILSDNQLDLTMSSSVSLWSDMQTLDLSGNSINGGLPGTIGSLKSLIQLNVANCQITGEIPPEIGGIDTLIELELQQNFFTGSLPEGLWDLKDLKLLRLEKNQFSGTLSSAIGKLTDLQELSLERTGLSGDLPESLGDLKSLEIAHFQFNTFKGEIPEALCEVESLVDLSADCVKRVDCSCCTQCCELKKDEYQCT